MGLNKMYYELHNQFKEDLLENEQIRWAGQPATKTYLQGFDVFIIPFAIIWTGMSLFFLYQSFQTYDETGFSFSMISNIIFVAIGFILLFARFVWLENTKKNTFYVVTDKRVLLITKKGGSKRVRAEFIKNLSSINKKIRRNGVGTIIFGKESLSNKYGNSTMLGGTMGGTYDFYGPTYPAFFDIPDAERVYGIVYDIWKKTQET